jgi:hypothetical protein
MPKNTGLYTYRSKQFRERGALPKDDFVTIYSPEGKPMVTLKNWDAIDFEADALKCSGDKARVDALIRSRFPNMVK